MTLQAARFERIGNLIDLIRKFGPFLSGLDLTKLGDLISAVSAFASLTSDPASQAGIVERIHAGIKILDAEAALTATTVDDSLDTFAHTITANEDAVNYVAGIIAQLLAKGHAPTAENVKALAMPAEVAALNLDWSKIFELVQFIIQLIASFKKPAA